MKNINPRTGRVETIKQTIKPLCPLQKSAIIENKFFSIEEVTELVLEQVNKLIDEKIDEALYQFSKLENTYLCKDKSVMLSDTINLGSMNKPKRKKRIKKKT